MSEASFSEQNNKCFLEKLRYWVCIVVTRVIMAGPSEVCENCPSLKSIEIHHRTNLYVEQVFQWIPHPDNECVSRGHSAQPADA